MAKAISTIARFCAVVLLGLICVTQLLFSALHDRLSVTVYFAGWWASFLGNIAAICFAIPAFNRTKDRPWLYVACAASVFACSLLVEIVVILMTLGELPGWVYVIYEVGYMVGMVFYASGIVSLARRTKLTDARQPSNNSPESSAGRSAESL